MNDQIYVALLNEGTNVWRPVKAQKLVDSVYRIEPTADYDPELEEWEFPPGSTVICEPRRTADGEILAAVRLKVARRRSA